MKRMAVVRSEDRVEFENAVNKFLNGPVWIIDIRCTTVVIYDKFNSQGIPINGTVLDTAYIQYEDDPRLMEC